MRVKVEVFTSPTCPHCPSAVRLARSVEEKIPDIVKVVETSSGTHFGYQRMKKFNIMATPTIIISGPAISEKIGFRGTPSREKFLKAISEASGMPFNEIKKMVDGNPEKSENARDVGEETSRTLVRKRGFFDKLLSLIKKK